MFSDDDICARRSRKRRERKGVLERERESCLRIINERRSEDWALLFKARAELQLGQVVHAKRVAKRCESHVASSHWTKGVALAHLSYWESGMDADARRVVGFGGVRTPSLKFK